MSDHDPFDGIYDTAPAQQEQSRSEVTVVAPDDVDVSVVGEDDLAVAPGDGSGATPRHLSKTEITRMDKAELRAAADERGLDSSGSRPELQERLREHQGD